MSLQKNVEETKKIKESFRIRYRETSALTYEVRAEDMQEVDEYSPDDLEVMNEDNEFIDSDREDVERFLSNEEDEERLHAHEEWKKNPKEGERFHIEECAVEYGSKITAEYDGAEFIDCVFSHTSFSGVNFETLNLDGSRFSNCTVEKCAGLMEEEYAKPGSLWFLKERDWQAKTKDTHYKYTPVIIKKWISYQAESARCEIAHHLEFLKENKMRKYHSAISNLIKELPCKKD